MPEIAGALTPRRARRLSLVSMVLAFVPGLAGVATLSAADPPPAIGQIGLMPVSEIRRGMIGTVRTVFEGNHIEEFGAEIVGVMNDFLGPGQDLILARLKGERVEFTGVAGGMSGSPVYVDGRLIGAVSYRLGDFPKEPIAGITPIHDMLKVGDAGRVASHAMPREIGIDLALIDTPLIMSGAPPSFAALFREDFLKAGLGSVVSGAGAASQQGPTAIPEGAGRGLLPGEPVAAQLMTGDLSLAATGTVTYVDGDHVYAFGHPALVNGEAAFPMARAEIFLTLTSLQASNKMARVLETVGSFRQSRLHAMDGLLGPKPHMLPVTVRVRGPAGNDHRFSYESVEHRELTPLLIGLAAGASIANTPRFADEMTVVLEGRVELPGHPDLLINDVYTGFPGSPPAALVMGRDVQGLFGAVWQNRWEAPRATSVEIDVKVVEKAKVTLIEGVHPTRTTLAAGESMEFRVQMRDYRGAVVSRIIPLTIPEGTPSGPVIAYIGGAALMGAVERNTIAKQAGQAENLDQLIGIINQLRPGDRLVLKVVRRQAGAIVQNEILPALPPSVAAIFGSARLSGEVTPVTETTLYEEEISLGQIVAGGMAIPLMIK